MAAVVFTCPAIKHCKHRTIRGAWCHFRTDESIPAQDGFEYLVVEILVHEIARWQRDDPHKLAHILLADTA